MSGSSAQHISPSQNLRSLFYKKKKKNFLLRRMPLLKIGDLKKNEVKVM